VAKGTLANNEALKITTPLAQTPQVGPEGSEKDTPEKTAVLDGAPGGPSGSSGSAANSESAVVKLGKLEVGMKGIAVQGMIQGVGEAKMYTKSGGTKGVLLNALMGDEEGREARLTFWNKAVAATGSLLSVGSTVRCYDGRVEAAFLGKLQVSFEKDPKCVRADAPGCRLFLEPTPISEIDVMMKRHDLDVQGIVLSASDILERCGKPLRELTVGDQSRHCIRSEGKVAPHHHRLLRPGRGAPGGGRLVPPGGGGAVALPSHQGELVGRVDGVLRLRTAAWRAVAWFDGEGLLRRCVPLFAA